MLWGFMLAIQYLRRSWGAEPSAPPPSERCHKDPALPVMLPIGASEVAGTVKSDFYPILDGSRALALAGGRWGAGQRPARKI